MYLLDGSVLVALALEGHVHHEAAHRWWVGTDGRFAMCPITQGTLWRTGMGAGQSAHQMHELLREFSSLPGHTFWADDVSYVDVDPAPLRGRAEVTDAYLAALARRHGSTLATFDRGLAETHRDVVELVSVV